MRLKITFDDDSPNKEMGIMVFGVRVAVTKKYVKACVLKGSFRAQVYSEVDKMLRNITDWAHGNIQLEDDGMITPSPEKRP